MLLLKKEQIADKCNLSLEESCGRILKWVKLKKLVKKKSTYSVNHLCEVQELTKLMYNNRNWNSGVLLGAGQRGVRELVR